VLPYNAKLKERSRHLRKPMTDAEVVLWSKLRMKQLKGFQFFRQKPIGGYIADFFCMKAKLVIEIDGGQHFSDDIADYDRSRDERLKSLGLKVLRFTNTEVLKNINGVIDIVLDNLKAKSPLVPLLKRGK
jgi:very-short-patch-repair endonuclease